MQNFKDFFDRINGESYTDIPPPVKYNFQNYTDSPVNGTESGPWALTPLQDEDMASAAAEDVVDNYIKMHKGKNPLRLGDPMSDSEFKKFMGQGW